MRGFFISAGTLVLGIFAGAMFLIATAIVPYWFSLPPQLYQESFRALGPFLGSTMIPLMLISILFTGIGIAIFKEKRRSWVIAFLCVLVLIPLYGLVHGPVNSLLLASTPFPDDTLLLLRQKWAFWHWVRSALGVGSFLVVIFALRR